MSKLLDVLMPLHSALEPRLEVGTLIELQREIVAWQNKTFPKGTVSGQCKHLIREAAELQDNPMCGEEMADCLILLLGIAQRGGVSIEILVDLAWEKFERCKSREWGGPDAEGVYHHIENPKQEAA